MPKARTMATTAWAKSERPVGFTTPESASTEDTSSSDPVDDDNHETRSETRVDGSDAGPEYKEMFAIHTQKMTVSYEHGTYVKKP